MATVLMIYSNQVYVGHKPLGISYLSAVAKENGHKFYLFDTSNYDFLNILTDSKAGEETLEFKCPVNPEREIPKTKVSYDNFVKEFLKMVELTNPDIIALSTTSDGYTVGSDLLKNAKEFFPDILTIVGGVHPTVDSEGVISENFVDLINIGEGETSFIYLLNSLKNKSLTKTDIPNTWIKKDGRIIKNSFAPLFDLDQLPIPDWSIYSDIQFYKPYLGYIYRYGDFELGRGCPYSCSYCISGYTHNRYNKLGKLYRRKNTEKAIHEFKQLKKQYNLEFTRFLDECFLLINEKEMEYFKELYVKEVDLPFVIETTAQSITPVKARLLREMNCVGVSIGIETLNYELRKNVLKKDTKNEVYQRAFELLNKEGIRTVAFIMVGIPHETLEDARLNYKVLKEWGVNTISSGFFYPYMGTPLRDYCIKNGLVSEEKLNENEKKNNPASFTRVGTILNFSEDYKKELERIKNCYILYKEVPDWLEPLIDDCKKESPYSVDLTRKIKKLVYKKRFGVDAPI